MNRILKGVIRYNQNVMDKAKFVADIDKVTRQLVQPLTVFVSCMDCRVLPSKFISSTIGEIYFLRNAGNMVPHFDAYKAGSISTEGGGLELGCITNKIRNVVVCGHSDCKAAHALYEIRHKCDHMHYLMDSPLRTWVALHGSRTVEKFFQVFPEDRLSPAELKEPMVFPVNLGGQDISARIDPDNHFSIQDKFSQLHCLEQASHVKTYPMLKPFVESGELHIHAMWFDVYTGNVYMFSPSMRKFVVVDDTSLNVLMKDAAESA
ncbi:beta carbonic anhydrase 1-like [Physella acuta]|uniref:beta carbonic anhydrase 1-like n=1 Tax=Physella acuta TaxID=109671 RepID=UPI0027DE94AE|nr:beta carbonic anhydrase 1-like [Physella acuta]